eukprot:gene12963-biopygen2251
MPGRDWTGMHLATCIGSYIQKYPRHGKRKGGWNLAERDGGGNWAALWTSPDPASFPLTGTQLRSTASMHRSFCTSQYPFLYGGRRAGGGGGGGGGGALTEAVKAAQREVEQGRNKWQRCLPGARRQWERDPAREPPVAAPHGYCDAEGDGVYDPARHPASFLNAWLSREGALPAGEDPGVRARAGGGCGRIPARPPPPCGSPAQRRPPHGRAPRRRDPGWGSPPTDTLFRPGDCA